MLPLFQNQLKKNIKSETRLFCFMVFARWKEIRHDNTVTWLAYWNDPINQKEFKYVFLAASSSLKGQSDKEKYEKARKLKVAVLLGFYTLVHSCLVLYWF